MSFQSLAYEALTAGSLVSMAIAAVSARAMHRHRQPSVTYRQTTPGSDGDWVRRDQFTDTGLRYQRRAAFFVTLGAACFVMSAFEYVLLDGR